ncbi:MAG: biopolymer transporter ExbD [Chitinophagales bacterium]|nr:biopolymer transporter ExbD [Chitinophagales bacterium]
MKLKTRNKVNPLFQMSSLTDIIFLLLIFFLLTSSFVAPNAIKLLLPSATTTTLSNQTISVSITDKLEYYVENKKVSFGGLQKEIQKALRGLDDPAPTVVLRVDKRVDVENLVRVLKLGNDMKVKMILATQKE